MTQQPVTPTTSTPRPITRRLNDDNNFPERRSGRLACRGRVRPSPRRVVSTGYAVILATRLVYLLLPLTRRHFTYWTWVSSLSLVCIIPGLGNASDRLGIINVYVFSLCPFFCYSSRSYSYSSFSLLFNFLASSALFLSFSLFYFFFVFFLSFLLIIITIISLFLFRWSR